MDLGSGDGTHLCYLGKQGFEVYGIEISEEGVKKTLQNAKNFNTIKVLKRDIFLSLPFNNGFFDAVFSFQALNHNRLPSICNVFLECNRVLKEGGIFSCPQNQ